MARKNLSYMANYATVYILCPDTPYDEELMSSIKTMINAVDYDNHYANGPIFTLGAYWMMQNKSKNQEI